MDGKILIADADPVQRRLLEEMISGFGYKTVLAGTSAEVASIIANSLSSISLIVLDLNMPKLGGFGFLKKLRATNYQLPIIIQTSNGGIETIVDTMRAGATDFFIKPISAPRLKQSIISSISAPNNADIAPKPKNSSSKSLTFNDIISSSPKMTKVIKLAKMAAKSNIPVIIEGETGVGKELIAKAIQGSSARSKQNFVTVNCGALPENLIESVLFGHEKGSFTGAANKHMGKFVEADGGTLFLDEVGELPLSTQIKLLRALQEGEVDPIGAKRSVQTDFRLISATNLSLEKECRSGNFREDLFYRLNVFPIFIPALRERREEIPELAYHFLSKFSQTENRSDIKIIDDDTLNHLSNHDWPGNIRQLENAIFRAVVLCEGSRLTQAHFPQLLPELSPAHGQYIDSVVPIKTIENAPTMSTEQNGSTKLVTREGQVKELEEIEAEVILFAIELYDGKLSEVAKRLGIGRSTLYRRLKELGINGNLHVDAHSA